MKTTQLVVALVVLVGRPAFAQEVAPTADEAPAEAGLRLTHIGLGALAAGLLAGALGLGFHASAGDKLDAARDRGTPQAEVASLVRDANDHLTRGDQLMLIGLILGAAGGGLCLVDLLLPALEGEGMAVSVVPTAGGGTAVVGWRF